MGRRIICSSFVIFRFVPPGGIINASCHEEIRPGFAASHHCPICQTVQSVHGICVHSKLESPDSLQTVLLFIELLASNVLSYRVFMNYISALKYMFRRYGWSCASFSHPLVLRLLKGVNYSVIPNPRPKGIFTFNQIREISSLCELFESTLTYRAAFLIAFYGLFRISNIAPQSIRLFDRARHLLRCDVKFEFPGVHIRLKWAKNVQAPEKIHVIKLPEVRDPLLCPVQTLRQLLAKKLPGHDPLLILDDYTLLTQTLLRKCLATFVRTLGLPVPHFGFHSFRRTGGTLAFDANTPLDSIKMQGLWSSDAIWSYISDHTSHSLQFPLALQRLANSLSL